MSFHIKFLVTLFALIGVTAIAATVVADNKPTAINRVMFIDTDMDTDDVASLHFLFSPNLKSETKLTVPLITIAGNDWTDLSSGVRNIYNLMHSLGSYPDIGVGFQYSWVEARQNHSCVTNCAVPRGGPDGWMAGGGKFETSLLFGMAPLLPQAPPSYRWKPGKASGAIEQLRAHFSKIRATGGLVTLLALGGMTTYATYFSQYPEDAALVEAMYTMGGAVNKPGNLFTLPSNPYAEFNIYVDPDAADFIFRKAGIPKIYVFPLDITDDIYFNYTNVWNRYLVNTSYTPAWLAGMFQADKDAVSGAQDFFAEIHPWDETAAIASSSPAFLNNVQLRKCPLRVVTDYSSNQLGRTVEDPVSGGQNVWCGVHVAQEVFWNEWLRVVHI